MMKSWKSVIAIACVTTMIVCLVSCTADPVEDPDTTSQSVLTSESETGSAPPPATDADTTAPETAPSNANTDSTVTTDPGTTVSAPQNVAQAVALYNSALKNTKAGTMTYSRKMGSGSFAGFNIMDFGVSEIFDRDGATVDGIKLVELQEGQVNFTSVAISGDLITVKLALKDTAGDSSLTLGAGGFIYFIDYNEATQLINEVVNQLAKGALTMTPDSATAKVALSGGSFTYVYNTKTQKVEKLTQSFAEHFEVKGKTNVGVSGVMEISGNGEGTMNCA